MNNRKFKTGDIVKLKSGSPEMTVRCYLYDDESQRLFPNAKITVVCNWWEEKNGNLQPMKITYLEDQLQLVSL
jgi:Uncharacterized small protein